MATLILGTVGSALGSSLLPAGLGILGASISGAAIGGLVGATIGQSVDAALFGPGGQSVEGPRLNDLKIQASTEGAPILRVYGRTRLAGQVIWATDFKENVTTTKQSTGGKGLGGGGGDVTVTEYSYSVSFAVGLAEGIIDRIGRVWADGKPLNLADFTVRVYKGTETQTPDSAIEAAEGNGNAPAYRGLAYVVFEDLPLEKFGNRVPQLNFEVFRSIPSVNGDSLENVITAVDMIPASGEFVYATSKVLKDFGKGVTVPENINNNMGAPDFTVSMDMLEDLLPNCKTVALVVAWFGDDLRCNKTTFKPGVELVSKNTTPVSWSVDGVARANAHLVSQVNGGPAFGGTPSDQAVVEAIQDIKARGVKVTFYPFAMMDIPAGNTLPDPYAPTGTQAVYPWRGRITSDPAPGVAGSPDKSAAVTSQIQSFFGTAAPANFSVVGTSVSYTGPVDWGWRRMVLHYAHLCAAAGGVDAFIIGSELRGLSTLRDAGNAFPTVSQFITLTADVSGILPNAKISYAADWSEYFGYQPADGTGDVYFHLDALWADSHVDFIGIDNYMPLSDWRDGASHLDLQAGFQSIHDVNYLKSNIEGGEGYDWVYKNTNDRLSQVRTNITDPTYSKPWVFKNKDIKNWWLNQHYNRPGGVESSTATDWVPQSKPVWFTETGCPAIDKGSNQPNVFTDPKSSESQTPYFSSGLRDDLIQRRFLEAVYEYWSASSGNNPTSSIYTAPMIDMASLHVWTWDARPFPDFPARLDFWSDGANWQLGHWLTGRVGQVPLPDLIRDLSNSVGLSEIDVSRVEGLVTGFAIDRIMSPRAALETLMLAFQFDAVESDGVIKFISRGGAALKTLADSSFAVSGKASGDAYTLVRAQETELPVAAKVQFINADGEYRQSTAESRRLTVESGRVKTAELAVVMDQARAQSLIDIWLMDSWIMRESLSFALAPSELALDPGDSVTLNLNGRAHEVRLTDINESGARHLKAVATDPSIYAIVPGAPRVTTLPPVSVFGPPNVAFLDLPLLSGTEDVNAPHVAGFAAPWPGAIDIYQSPATSGFVLNTEITAPAIMGVTLWDFSSGPTSRWDRGNFIQVDVVGGALQSTDDLSLLNGANIAAIQNADGAWEVFQFRDATLISGGIYQISTMLRGQAGTQSAMRDPVLAGAPFVLITPALIQLDLNANERGLTFNWRYGPRGLPLSDSAFVTQSLSFSSVGLRPLSPVHIKGVRQSNSDLDLSWIRRTRIGGDDWGGVDVPLGEDFESYDVDIMNGAAAVRTLTTITPNVTYTAVQQQTDWGTSPKSPLTVRVYQLGAIYGRGAYREKTLTV